MYYSIEIRYHGKDTGRHIEFNLDNGWYGAVSYPVFKYTRDEALSIIENLRTKYIYSVNLHGEDGSKEFITSLRSEKIFTPFNISNIEDDYGFTIEL